MIRKISHIIISLALILATAGISVTRHYCMGRVVSVNINHIPTDCCNNGHCNKCHDETKVCQVIDHFLASAFQIDFKNHTSTCFTIPSIEIHSSSYINFTSVNIFYDHRCGSISDNIPALLQVFRC